MPAQKIHVGVPTISMVDLILTGGLDIVYTKENPFGLICFDALLGMHSCPTEMVNWTNITLDSQIGSKRYPIELVSATEMYRKTSPSILRVRLKITGHPVIVPSAEPVSPLQMWC